MSEQTLRRTPLYDLHCKLGARMVPFAGWEMPVQYSGILDEVKAVRTNVGLFDISHMGRAHVHGPGATTLLDRLTTNDVAGLSPGKAHYTLLTNPHGGVIDDLIIYRAGDEDYWIVINASNAEKDLFWIRDHNQNGVEIEDWTDRTAMIAVQGPNAVSMAAQLADDDIAALPGFAFIQTRMLGQPVTVCRTGYTGEDGVELIVQPESAAGVWRRLLAAGAASCGLGARDALRIEAGYPLYGQEIDDSTTPVEAGLMWVVKLDKGQFTGCGRIAGVKEAGTSRKLVGLVMEERIVPRQGYTVYVGEDAVGQVTSGIYSPTTNRSVGMAYMNDPHNKTGTQVEVEIRGKRYAATVRPKKNLRDP